MLQEVQFDTDNEHVKQMLEHPTQVEPIKKLFTSKHERHYVALEQLLQGLTHDEQIHSAVFW